MIDTVNTDQDIQIAEFTLGLLTPQDAVQIQQRLGSDRTAARAALLWEARFLALVDALPSVTPPESMLEDIRTALDLDPLPQQDYAPQKVIKRQVAEETPKKAVPPAPDPSNTVPASPSRLSKSTWLGGLVVAVLLTGILALTFLPRTPVEPPITIIEVAPTKGAILQAPGNSTSPGWVMIVDEGGNVQMTPKVVTDMAPNTEAQLWTYGASGGTPRALGLIDINEPVSIPADVLGAISDDQFFEITQEPVGGSPSGKPNGPILFIGRLVTFG